MLTIQSGAEFIGYGPYQQCPNCNNKVIMSIREEYAKVGVMYLPLSTKPGRIFVQCSTCETAWKINKDEAIKLLEEGKKTTKAFLAEASPKRKKIILERLSKWGADSLVVFFGTN